MKVSITIVIVFLCVLCVLCLAASTGEINFLNFLKTKQTVTMRRGLLRQNSKISIVFSLRFNELNNCRLCQVINLLATIRHTPCGGRKAPVTKSVMFIFMLTFLGRFL